MKELEQSIQYFFGVSEDEVQRIASHFHRETLKKGTYFTRTGHVCDRLSFIQSGLLRIYVSTENKEVTQWISTKGYFVTELNSLLFRQRSRWNIQALVDCELYTISGEDYARLAGEVPKWHELEKLFIAKCFTTLEDRIFSFLSMSAEERFAMLFDKHRELFLEVPQQYLASMIGMTPETFSRLRRKNGLIS